VLVDSSPKKYDEKLITRQTGAERRRIITHHSPFTTYRSLRRWSQQAAENTVDLDFISGSLDNVVGVGGRMKLDMRTGTIKVSQNCKFTLDGRYDALAVAYERTPLDKRDVVLMYAAVAHCVIADAKGQHPVRFVRPDHKRRNDHRARLKIFAAAVLAHHIDPVDLANCRRTVTVFAQLQRETAIDAFSFYKALFLERFYVLGNAGFRIQSEIARNYLIRRFVTVLCNVTRNVFVNVLLPTSARVHVN